MAKRLRFTGEWPPLTLLPKYPNWEYALDEEGTPGQDETTLRPAREQGYLTTDVAFTAARVTLASGEALQALVELLRGAPDAVNGFVTDADAWRVMRAQDGSWVPYVETWLPPKERGPSVAQTDAAIFPFTVETAVSARKGGQPDPLPGARQRSLRSVG